jgi:hypothetical protein
METLFPTFLRAGMLSCVAEQVLLCGAMPIWQASGGREAVRPRCRCSLPTVDRRHDLAAWLRGRGRVLALRQRHRPVLARLRREHLQAERRPAGPQPLDMPHELLVQPGLIFHDQNRTSD